MKLIISKDISLPLDTVTQAIAILAKRRVGKSYTMRRMVEQLFEASQQVVLVDPKGDQWGIRSSADGKKPGYPMLILGGEHGDLPLEVNSGEMIANLVVKERVSVLLDISLFRKHEVATFMTAFLENLYRLKAQEAYRTPLMLVIDEADAIAPQKPQKGEERMLGAANDIVRRGGQRGIGCTLVTQRSAVLNKNVLTQCELIVVLRTVAPQDLSAMKAWIDVHGTPEQGKELMESLPSLPIGDAWFWSPGWPTEAGIFKRTHVLPITTFDSGATPKVGQRKVVPKNLADVDLAALKDQMAATIETAKANDPKHLKAEIVRLTKELEKKVPVADTAPMGVSQWMQYGAKYGYDKFFREKIEKEWKGIVDGANKAIKKLQDALKGIGVASEIYKTVPIFGQPVNEAAIDAVGSKVNIAAPPIIVSQRQKEIIEKMPQMERAGIVTPGTEPIQKGEKLVLNAIAQNENGLNRSAITILTSYKKSTRNRYIQYLQQKGFLREEGEKLYATQEGIDALGGIELLPTGAALWEHYLKILPEGESKILHLLGVQGRLTRESISEQTGYQKSTRNRYIQYLQARELVSAEGEYIVISEKLCD